MKYKCFHCGSYLKLSDNYRNSETYKCINNSCDGIFVIGFQDHQLRYFESSLKLNNKLYKIFSCKYMSAEIVSIRKMTQLKELSTDYVVKANILSMDQFLPLDFNSANTLDIKSIVEKLLNMKGFA